MNNLEKIIQHGENYKKLKEFEKIDIIVKDDYDIIQEKLKLKEVVKCIIY